MGDASLSRAAGDDRSAGARRVDRRRRSSAGSADRPRERTPGGPRRRTGPQGSTHAPGHSHGTARPDNYSARSNTIGSPIRSLQIRAAPRWTAESDQGMLGGSGWAISRPHSRFGGPGSFPGPSFVCGAAPPIPPHRRRCQFSRHAASSCLRSPRLPPPPAPTSPPPRYFSGDAFQAPPAPFLRNTRFSIPVYTPRVTRLFAVSRTQAATSKPSEPTVSSWGSTPNTPATASSFL